MQKKINKISIALSIALVFLGMKVISQQQQEYSTTDIFTDKTLQAWIYPGNTGEQTCNASSEFSDGRRIDALKVEYLTLDDNGVLHVIKANSDNSYLPETSSDYLDKCNGFSIANASLIKSTSTYKFITISLKRENQSGLDEIYNNSTIRTAFITKLKTFLQYMYDNNVDFTGIELDFECYWNEASGQPITTRWEKYQSVINDISSAIKAPGGSYSFTSKLLIVDGPALLNNTTSAWDYSFFNGSNVDFACVMTYDYDSEFLYQYQLDNYSTTNPPNGVPPYNMDFGSIAPYTWIGNAIDYVKSKMPNNINKIIIGLPSYGYKSIKKSYTGTEFPNLPYTYDFAQITKNEVLQYANYNTAVRDNLSSEMKFFTRSVYENIDPVASYKSLNEFVDHPVYFQDAVGMSKKIEFIRSKGIRHVSVWSLGGNDWFTRYNIANNQVIDSKFKLPTSASQSLNWDMSSGFPDSYYNSSGHTTNVKAETSNISSNELILNGYAFNNEVLNPDNKINGFEVVIIGRSKYNATELKSTISVELYNGQYSIAKTIQIHSPQDIINVLGDKSDNWGLQWDNLNINNFKVRVKLISGPKVYISAVFVKPYCYKKSGTMVFKGKSSSDDARCKDNITGGISESSYNESVFTQYLGSFCDNCIYTDDGNQLNYVGLEPGSGNVKTFSYYRHGLRFPDISIPKGSIILNATLDFYYAKPYKNGITGIPIVVYGDKTGNSEPFSFSKNPVFRFPTMNIINKTINQNYFYNPGYIVNNDGTINNNINNLINVNSIVQELVNRSDWDINNSISIIIQPDYSVNQDNWIGFSTWNYNNSNTPKGSRSAKLTIDCIALENCSYTGPNNSITISGNVNWDTPKVVYQSITIPQNSTLTITSEIKFTNNVTIIVEKGGKLIVDGGTLKSYCTDGLWQGIIVQGDNTKSQFDLTKHGLVDLKNNATIANAIIGIQTHNYMINSNSSSGGIIKAYNANFYNNKIAVRMFDFTNKTLSGGYFPDVSTFKNCSFIKDDNFSSSENFLYFINFSKISGIEIMGCRFKNLSSNIASDYSNAGMGIYSYNADFIIDNYVNQTEFHNLFCGIFSSGGHKKPIKVKRALLNNNLHGMYVKNFYNAWLTANTFKIPERFEQINNNIASQNSAYGMYLDYCAGYIVEGNSFNKVDPTSNNPSPNKAAYGLIINETGAPFDAANSVYNNSFQNIERSATQSQGNNSGYGDEEQGLKIKCNDYSDNKQDISVIGQGISIFQGTNTYNNSPEDKKKPAGNTFSKFGPIVLIDFTDLNNGGANIDYYHHAGDNAYSWVPKFCNPEPKVSPFAGVATYTIKEETCPGIALQTGTPQPYPYNAIQLNTLIQQKSAQLNTSKLIYSLWVDNGNTEGLRHDIKISTTWDAFDLYNELLLGSPKLSEEVLIDAIKREDVLTPLMLKLVLLANPQVCRYEKAWNALINRVNPLPDAWIDEIKQGLAVISPIENMQADISYYASERNTYMNLLKQCYLSDTTETGMQQYLSLLNNESDIESKYELVFAKISNQDYEGALSTLSSIETMIDREKYPEEADRYANMKNLIPVLITIETSHPRWNDLSENDRNLLINLSETDNTVTGSLATACRMALDAGFVYSEPIYIPTDRPLKMSLPKKGKTAVVNEQHIKISPNPASDYIAIEFNTEGVGTNLRLQITDAMGKTVLEKELDKAQQIIDIREFAKGSYYCTVYNNGKALDTVKFIKK